MNWTKDLEQLAEDLPKFHHNFFHNISKQEFTKRIEALIADSPQMNTYKMVAELSKVIALAGDAHTALELPRSNMMPLKCYWFEEGIYIIGTSADYQELLHNKIVEIEGVPISEIIEELSEMISHENQQFVKAQLPGLLVCTDILVGLGICGIAGNASMKVEAQDGSQIKVVLPAISYKEWEKVVCENARQDQKKLPLYRQNDTAYYWSEEIHDGEILYVNYKKCRDMDGMTIGDFTDDLKATLEKNGKIKTLILDYRNNNGGNSELLRPFIEWLSDFQQQCREADQPFKIFVIVGRDTFSSALLNVFLLKFKTKATFVGEPTGGKPNCYGEVNYFKLRESGLSVRYSTRYYYIIEEYDLDAFYPDVTFACSFKDYVENKDPCIEWILNNAD